MSSQTDLLTHHFDEVLEEHGIVPCLMALAQVIRVANDRNRIPPDSEAQKHLGYVREYVANQVMGLAAFWRVHLPETQHR